VQHGEPPIRRSNWGAEQTQILHPAGRSEPWWRRSSALAVGTSALALVVLLVAAFVALRPDPAPGAAEPPGPTLTLPLTADATPTSSLTATATATTSPTPRVTRTQVPIPSQHPTEPAPPPPPPAPPGPPPSDPPSCTQWNPAGDAPRDVVRTALSEAGARNYWSGVSKPNGWPAGSSYPPAISVPSNLMYAVAWTESDWRSTVIACDGGIGLMQVMPNTAPWMNQRFNRNYSVSTVDGNAAIGAMYLEWLTMYFGLYYFGSFDLEAVAPLREGGGNIKLGDVIIAAYNVGYAAVENLHGTKDSADDTLSIPNQWYVDRVRKFQTQKPWEAPPTTPPAAATTAG
jgi:hypothetical protein